MQFKIWFLKNIVIQVEATNNNSQFYGYRLGNIINTN